MVLLFVYAELEIVLQTNTLVTMTIYASHSCDIDMTRLIDMKTLFLDRLFI